MNEPNNEIEDDKNWEEMRRAEAARKARQRTQMTAARRQAINCDYIVRMEIDGERPTSIAIFMNTGKKWRIEKETQDGDNSSTSSSSLYEFYNELINRRSGLVNIPPGLRLSGN